MATDAAKKRIASNFVVIGVGLLLVLLPMIPLFFGIFSLAKAFILISPVTFLGGLYVIGLGVAGITIGIVEIVRAIK